MTKDQTSAAGAAARGTVPTVAVIGTGIAGLTSAKALQDYGIPCTVFEIGDHIGGNWAFRNSNGRSSAYRSLHIDTSRVGMSLSVLGTPVKVGSVELFVLFGLVPVRVWGGGPQSGSRWSARSAARTNDLEADKDPPHTVFAGTEAKCVVVQVICGLP